MRRFNVTGLCVPEEDYMVDIGGKIGQIKKLIDDGSYLTINRARQYGKTTTLNELRKTLSDEYIVISLSFQGIGDESFASSGSFCRTFIRQIVRALRFTAAPKEYIEKWNDGEITEFEELSYHITDMCEGKKIVLMIDEVDQAGNNRVFLQFLGMLRDKFLSRKAGQDYTFHSVILAGVYDIKNIRVPNMNGASPVHMQATPIDRSKMINEGLYAPAATENKLYNSPWNIAINFTVDMSFNPIEIETMLSEYKTDHDIRMDIISISKEIHSYTNGYPFLVSRICQCIYEELNQNWTNGGIRQAINILLTESNTLFDDMFKNIENNKELSDLIYALLILREIKPFVIDDPVVGVGVIYGFLKNVNQTIAIANKIFELRMINYYISKDLRNKRQITGVLQSDVVRGVDFDMELCLRKFADHYDEIYNETDREFLERHGRLLFLSYLKPLINGRGFYHIESQFVDLRRMDIVVDFGRQQFILELKLWNGKSKHREAYEQLCGYLESKRVDAGYLLSFDFRRENNRDRKAEWVEVNGKRIFDVVV